MTYDHTDKKQCDAWDEGYAKGQMDLVGALMEVLEHHHVAEGFVPLFDDLHDLVWSVKKTYGDNECPTDLPPPMLG